MKPRDGNALKTPKSKLIKPKDIRQEMKTLGMARKERQAKRQDASKSHVKIVQQQQYSIFKPKKEQLPQDTKPDNTNTFKNTCCLIQ